MAKRVTLAVIAILGWCSLKAFLWLLLLGWLPGDVDPEILSTTFIIFGCTALCATALLLEQERE